MFNYIAIKRCKLVLKILARHDKDPRNTITEHGTNINSVGFI